MNLGKASMPGVWACQVGPGKRILIWHQIKEEENRTEKLVGGHFDNAGQKL